MNAIAVGYRFAREELSTLLQALRLGPLPGAPLDPVDEDAAQLVLKQLAEKELALVADGTIYVDRLTNSLLSGASHAKSAVTVTDGQNTAVLWDAGQFYILGEFPAHGDCTVTPLQNLQMAQESFSDALCRLSRPLWCVNALDHSEPIELAAQDAVSGQAAASIALKLLKPAD